MAKCAKCFSTQYVLIRTVFFVILVSTSLVLIHTIVTTTKSNLRITLMIPNSNNLTRLFSETAKPKQISLDQTIIENVTAIHQSKAKEGQRQDSCNNCFKHNFGYIIDNEDICNLYGNQTEIDLLILIFTVHGNVRQRNALRDTWLTLSKNNKGNARYAFLLGEIDDAKLGEAVIKENQVYKDMIKEDFKDSYGNLTYKTIMGFKWAVTRCKDVRFVFKIDDDMYLNIPNVLKIAEANVYLLNTSIIGACSKKAKPIRDEKSKWYASIESYPRTDYPGFCSGTGYLTSMNVVKEVYHVSPNVPFFHLEDVYVALCLEVLGFHVTPFPGFNINTVRFRRCMKNSNVLVTAHHMNNVMLRRLWNSKCVDRPTT